MHDQLGTLEICRDEIAASPGAPRNDGFEKKVGTRQCPIQ